MKINLSTEIKIPKPPNFVRTLDDKAIPVCELSERELCNLRDAWFEGLVKRAHEQRRQKYDTGRKV